MVRLLLVATLVSVGFFLSTEAATHECQLGEWSEWSDCKQPKECPQKQRRSAARSFHLRPKGWDKGRDRQARLMAEKEEEAKTNEECIANQTCPELFDPQSEGYAPCVDGMAGNWPCRNVDLLSFVNFEDLGYSGPHVLGNDIWGWHDEETGDEYAIMGLSAGTSFVRVTDPLKPVVLGFLPTHTNLSMWHDITVYKDHAYIVSEATDHGMQVFDLRQLRGKTDFALLKETNHYGEVGNAHNVQVNVENGFVYIVGANRNVSAQNVSYPNVCKGGLHVVDVKDPGNPQFTSCFDDDGYIHDVECVIYHGPDSRYKGHEICFGYNENSLTLMDLTVHVNPQFISKMGYPNVGYCHQGSITEDHTIILMDDEMDEVIRKGGRNTTSTLIWDVTDLHNPELKNTYYSTETSIDHNQYIHGSLAFQSNYEAGLRILYIDQKNYDLEEVAYFDMRPDSTTLTFDGTWSNYPFFRNGVVASTSINYGLFLQQPNYEAIAAAIANREGLGYAEQTRTRKIVSSRPGYRCGPRVEVRQCDVTSAC